MAQVITIISNDVKSGKTTIAFSLATILANKNKKVLLVNQEYGSSYLELLTKENKTISKNVIAPFVMIEHTKRLTVLLFSNGKVNQNKHDYSKLFPKQLQLLESKFEYIIIDASYIWNSLTNIALENSRRVLAVYDSNNFSSNQLQKVLTFVRKNQNINYQLKLTTIILNNYNPNVHMTSLLEIIKMMGDNYLFITLPHRKELQKISDQSIKFVKYNQWDDYTMMLNKVVNQILKNT